jgi:hypothetical protein
VRVYFDDFPIFENWLDQSSRHAHETSVTVERAESPGGVALTVHTGGMPITTLRIDIAADARGELVGACGGTWSTDQPGHPHSQEIRVLEGLLFVNSNYPARANPLHVKFALAYEVDGRRSMISGGFAVSY